MELLAIAVVAAAFILYALVSGRLEGTILTAPLLFAAFGFLIGPGGFAIADLDRGHGFLHVVAELTLVLVLFADVAGSFLREAHQ